MTMIWEDIGMRSYMEDKTSFEPNIYKGFSYYGVFDGHGGAQVSTYLQLHMKSAVKQNLIRQDTMTGFIDVPKVLFDSFQDIVNAIPNQISTDTGSTAVVLLRNKNKIWVANAGDSRAIMNNGHFAQQLTMDHKPTRTDEHQRITSLGGKVIKAFERDVYRVNGVLAVSRAIGDFALSPHVTWKPEISAYTLQKRNHYVVIATDGIWDVLPNDAVISIVNEYIMKNDWKGIGNKLILQSRRNGSEDNIACMLLIL